MFTIPPYSPKLNQIEHASGILKNKNSLKNILHKRVQWDYKENIKMIKNVNKKYL